MLAGASCCCCHGQSYCCLRSLEVTEPQSHVLNPMSGSPQSPTCSPSHTSVQPVDHLSRLCFWAQFNFLVMHMAAAATPTILFIRHAHSRTCPHGHAPIEQPLSEATAIVRRGCQTGCRSCCNQQLHCQLQLQHSSSSFCFRNVINEIAEIVRNRLARCIYGRFV